MALFSQLLHIDRQHSNSHGQHLIDVTINSLINSEIYLKFWRDDAQYHEAETLKDIRLHQFIGIPRIILTWQVSPRSTGRI